MHADVIVIGLGAMGSAATYALARRGLRVLALDRYTPPHTHGSSHGHTRMIREAYFEHPIYVPLVRRAYQLWEELEHAAGGKTFFRKTGGLYIGPPDSTLVAGAIASAVQHRIPHEILSAKKLHRRFPIFYPLDEWSAVFELRAGMLFVEPILHAFHELARKKSAELQVTEEVFEWSVEGGVARVVTSRGVHEAGHLVFCAGPWMHRLLPALGLPLTVERQVTHWFDASRDEHLFALGRMPCTLWQFGGDRVFYTMPNAGDGVKVGEHHHGATVNPDAVSRQITTDEDAFAVDLLRRFIPFAKGHVRASSTCLYTNTPDGHFIVDRHPAHPEVTVLSACSGHGFKFASALGDVVADMVQGKTPAFDLSPFRLSRFDSAVS